MLKLFDFYFGFGATRVLLVALRSNTAQGFDLLIRSLDLAIQSAECGSGNNTNDLFGRGLALSVHLVLLKFDLDCFGLLTPTCHCFAIGWLSVLCCL